MLDLSKPTQKKRCPLVENKNLESEEHTAVGTSSKYRQMPTENIC